MPVQKGTPSAVRQYTRKGVLVAEFDSSAEAARAMGCSPSLISKGCCRAPSVKTCKGFVWRYVSDDEIAAGDMTAIELLNGGKPIRQYTPDGTFLKEYHNLTEATEQSGVPKNGISASCRRYSSHVTAGGFAWRYAEDDEIAKGDKSFLHLLDTKRPIRQYSPDGKFVAEFEGVRIATRETGIWNSNISACCHRKQGYATAGGYIWRFKDDDEFAVGSEVTGKC